MKVSPVMTYLPEVNKNVPVSPTAPPNKIALSLPIGVIVWPKRAMGLSPSNLTYSIDYLFFDFTMYLFIFIKI